MRRRITMAAVAALSMIITPASSRVPPGRRGTAADRDGREAEAAGQNADGDGGRGGNGWWWNGGNGNQPPQPPGEPPPEPDGGPPTQYVPPHPPTTPATHTYSAPSAMGSERDRNWVRQVTDEHSRLWQPTAGPRTDVRGAAWRGTPDRRADEGKATPTPPARRPTGRGPPQGTTPEATTARDLFRRAKAAGSRCHRGRAGVLPARGGGTTCSLRGTDRIGRS